MFMKTDRLIIRDLETADGIIFLNMAADGGLKEIFMDTECDGWMDEWIAEARQLAGQDDPTADYLAYAVELKETHEVIGSVGCSYYQDLEKVGIVYFVGTEYRNHGYATEAIKAYTRYFLQHYPQDEMIATIREDNAPSWRAVEKAGFGLTGQKRYQDIGDETERNYRFYSCRKECLIPEKGEENGL